jgi:hypothetical protein
MQRSGERNLNDATSQLFYHASVLILISAVAQGPWVNEDCSLAAENLRRAVYGAGLGNCWIGFAQSLFLHPREMLMPKRKRKRLILIAITERAWTRTTTGMTVIK